MRAVVQRVAEAQVVVEEREISRIQRGLLVLLGVSATDTDEDASYIVDKLINLRVFPDSQGKLNLSVKDIGGEILLVSQFTLYGDCRRGRRPSFTAAAKAELAEALYERVAADLRASGLKVGTGVFGADMKVGAG